MSEPKTLRQMAGAPSDPSPLSQSTVIIIDAQREYTTGALPLTGVDAAADRVAQVLHKARAAGSKIIHVAHDGAEGSLFDRAADRGQFMPQAEPEDGEPVVLKTLPNGFAHTDLLDRVKEAGNDQLILAGFMTHMCVSSTARAALDLGYQTTVVADACATRPLPNPIDGTPIDGKTLHDHALAGLADRFSVITTADKLEA